MVEPPMTWQNSVMIGGEGTSGNSGGGAIPAWRIVAGAFVHFVVPAYVIIVPLICLFRAPEGAAIGELVRMGVPVSGWFLAGYAGVGLVSVIAALAIDPILHSRSRRREARDPRRGALSSEQRVARALTDGRRFLNGRATTVLDSISRPRWDHADPRFQALSADLDEVVHASAAALATAAPTRRGAIMDIATASLERIDAALAALLTERGRLDEDNVRTVARYVEMRYGKSDFTGDDP